MCSCGPTQRCGESTPTELATQTDYLSKRGYIARYEPNAIPRAAGQLYRFAHEGFFGFS